MKMVQRTYFNAESSGRYLLMSKKNTGNNHYGECWERNQDCSQLNGFLDLSVAWTGKLEWSSSGLR